MNPGGYTCFSSSSLNDPPRPPRTARRTGQCVPNLGRQHPGHRARHWLGLWRQTQRRGGHRSGATRSHGRQVKVIRATSAFECGTIVNPDHLKNQIEGAMVMGLGGALFEAIPFDNGRILNPRFSSYRVPRFIDTPQIEVVLIDRKDLPSAGAGETPIVGIAPAIGNAIFAACGVRLRSLPLAPRGIKM